MTVLGVGIKQTLGTLGKMSELFFLLFSYWFLFRAKTFDECDRMQSSTTSKKSNELNHK